MQIRRVVARSILILLVTVLLVIGLGFGWLRYRTADLPDISVLRCLAGGKNCESPVAEIDGEPVPVWTLSREALGPNIWNAVLAAEGELDTRSWPRRFYEDYTTDLRHRRFGNYSFQIARTLPYPNARYRALAESRTAMQIERRFTPDEILTIFINRVYLGDGLHGVSGAARRICHRTSSDLTVPEAALLAGMIASPTRFSPEKHPDQALSRRNWVIDRMVNRGSLAAVEAQKAKSAPLLVPWLPAPVLLGAPRTAALAQLMCQQLPNVRMIIYDQDKNDTFTGNDEVGYPLEALGEASVPCLIDRITDTTWMPDPRSEPLIGAMRVGDTAFWSLMILGVDWDIVYSMLDRKRFDEVGVGAYFEWIERPGHRRQLQSAVRGWVRAHPNCCSSKLRIEQDFRTEPEFRISSEQLAVLTRGLTGLKPGMSEVVLMRALGAPDLAFDADSPLGFGMKVGEQRGVTFFVDSWSGNKAKRDLLRDRYVTLFFNKHGKLTRAFSNVEGIPPVFPKGENEWQTLLWE